MFLRSKVSNKPLLFRKKYIFHRIQQTISIFQLAQHCRDSDTMPSRICLSANKESLAAMLDS